MWTVNTNVGDRASGGRSDTRYIADPPVSRSGIFLVDLPIRDRNRRSRIEIAIDSDLLTRGTPLEEGTQSYYTLQVPFLPPVLSTHNPSTHHQPTTHPHKDILHLGNKRGPVLDRKSISKIDIGGSAEFRNIEKRSNIGYFFRQTLKYRSPPVLATISNTGKY